MRGDETSEVSESSEVCKEGPRGRGRTETGGRKTGKGLSELGGKNFKDATKNTQECRGAEVLRCRGVWSGVTMFSQGVIILPFVKGGYIDETPIE